MTGFLEISGADSLNWAAAAAIDNVDYSYNVEIKPDILYPDFVGANRWSSRSLRCIPDVGSGEKMRKFYY